jgi:O-antigen ligase
MSGGANLLRRVIWFGLLAIVVVSPTQYGLEIAKWTYISVADPLVWGVFALWLISLALQRWTPVSIPASDRASASAVRVQLRHDPLMAILFIIIASLSLIHAVHPMKGVKDIVQLVEYFVVTFMLFASVPDRARIRTLVNVFLAIASVVILVGVVQYWIPGISDFKVRSTFGNRNVLGGYLALVVPFMLGIALYEPAFWRRAWLLTIVALALLVTLSGGALIAMALTLALLCAMRGKPAFIAFATVFAVIVLLILPRLPRHNDVILDESVRLFNDRNEVSLRYTEWQAATVMISEQPWLGVGIGNYQDNIGGYFGVLPRPTGVVEHDSENLYLVMASSTGWLGLAAFLGMIFTFGITAARRFFTLTDPYDRGLALGLLGAILSFTICGIWHPLLVRGIGIPLAIVFALTACRDAEGATVQSVRHPAGSDGN